MVTVMITVSGPAVMPVFTEISVYRSGLPITTMPSADALAAIFDLVRFANAEANTESSRAFIGAVKAEILKLGDVLGLIFEKKEDSLDAEVEKMIEERQEARKAKDYAKADAIRQKLLDMGIELKDTREGVKWNRI